MGSAPVRRIARVALTLWLAGAASELGSTQSLQLNASLQRPKSGAVLDYRISPDGTRVAYRADQAFDEVFELFSAPIDGSAPAVRLHPPLLASQLDVLELEIGAVGRVVFRADLRTNETVELFSVPIDGSALPIVLSGALVAFGDVASFQLTADGTRVVYLADALVNNRSELFSVPVDGGSAPVRLDPLDREATGLFRITPAGDVVVYATDDPGSDRERLYAVPTDASALPLLLGDSGGLVTGFGDLTIASDGLHAAYVPIEAQQAGLFGLTLDGSQAPAQLHIERDPDGFPPHALAGNRVVYVEPAGDLYTIESDGSARVLLALNAGAFTLAPDGSKVAFLAGAFGTSTLYVAPVDGSSAPTVLAGPAVLESPRFSASSDGVLFVGALPSAFRGLFAVSVTGGTPLLLNGPEIEGERGAEDFAIGPQGSAVVYREDRVADDLFELFSVDLDLEHHRLSGPLADWRDVLGYRIAPDGEHVAYLADQNDEATNELFGAPIGGGTAAVRLNATFPDGPPVGGVDGFRVTPDEARVVYVARQESPTFLDLFATASGGHGAPKRLTGPLTDRGDVGLDFALSPSGDHVVFQFLIGPDIRNARLYAGTTDGTGPVAQLDASTSGFLGPYTIDPSDAFVVYRMRDPELDDALVLRRADLDGDPPGFNLASPLFGTVQEFELTPDGSAVIYRAPQDVFSQIDLYRVPSGGGARLRLNTPPFPGADVSSFHITPDGSRVVYRGTQQTSALELFSVPSDGSGPPVKLNGTLPSGGGVLDFALTPLGVLYIASQVASDRYELFAVPFDGSSAPVRLTVLPAGHNGVQAGFATTADGTLAFYRADPTTIGHMELFVVPTDGSASPTRLSADALSFLLSPDEARVVYLADQRVPGVLELFSVPATGGPLTQLVTLPTFADVTAYRIDPGSTWAVYLADADTVDVLELWRVPIDGSAAPERVNPALPPGGDVEYDFVPLSDGGIVYRTDLRNNQAFELFRFLDVAPFDPLAPAEDPTRTRAVLR